MTAGSPGLSTLAALAGLAVALGTARVGLAAEVQDVHASMRALGLVTGQIRPGSLAATDVHAPTLQLLTIDARNVQGSGMFGAVHGYLSQQWGQAWAGRGADVMTGFVGWQARDQRVRVQAGRFAVFAGAPGPVFLDGAAATVRLPGDLRLSGHAGTGVYETATASFAAPVLGGRLAWMPWESGHLGIAFQELQAPSAGPVAEARRRTAGLDASFRAWQPLLLTASYAHDLIGGGLQEARLDANWRLDPHLSVHGRGEWRDPLAFLPRTSIFHAFVARTDGLVGGGFDLDTPGALSLSAGYDRFVTGAGGLDGYRTFAETRLRLDAAGRARAGLQVGRLFNGENGYHQARLYLSAQVHSRWTVTGDLDGYQFFQPIHGETLSTRAVLALRHALAPGVMLGVDGQVFRNPYFRAQALALVTLAVTEQAAARRPDPPPQPHRTTADEGVEAAQDKAAEP